MDGDSWRVAVSATALRSRHAVCGRAPVPERTRVRRRLARTLALQGIGKEMGSERLASASISCGGRESSRAVSPADAGGRRQVLARRVICDADSRAAHARRSGWHRTLQAVAMRFEHLEGRVPPRPSTAGAPYRFPVWRSGPPERNLCQDRAGRPSWMAVDSRPASQTTHGAKSGNRRWNSSRPARSRLV